MGRPDAEQKRRQVDFASIKDAASKHGGDRKALRRAARYAGMGQQPLNPQGFLPDSISRSENEGQSKI